MQKFTCLTMGLLFICSLLLPDYCEAASRTATHKAQVQKKSVQKKTVKKSAAKAKPAASGKLARAEKAGNDREIWMKRARNSEALTGKASWYGKDFHNKATASGLTYDMHTFTAAHRTLPIGTIVKVTDQNNGKSVMVCVTDRGPFIKDRIIDVSYAAARHLGLDKRGVGKVELEVVSDEHGAPLRKDQGYFVRYATHGGKTSVGPFHAFADAAAMREALSQAHPEAEVVLGKSSRK